jgi:hypothetical protein
VAGWGILASSAIYWRVAQARPYVAGMPDDLHVILIHVVAFAVPVFASLFLSGWYARRLG